jgi:hypothetical protein
MYTGPKSGAGKHKDPNWAQHLLAKSSSSSSSSSSSEYATTTTSDSSAPIMTASSPFSFGFGI